MAKKELTGAVAQLQKADLVIGTEETLKLLRKGAAKQVFIAANCSAQVRKDLEQYCKISDVELVELPQSSEEIGVICKKPFAISVAAIRA